MLKNANLPARLSLLSAAAALCCFAAACGQTGNDSETGAGSKEDNTLVVLNYGKYLDPSVIRMFEEETGIDIKLEESASPEEMYTKFTSGSIRYDVVCTSDYMVERLISEGQAAEIDFSGFEYYENLNPEIIRSAQIYDPENKYSLPYFYGTLGILYDTNLVPAEATESWSILWDETYADSIIMQNSVRDTFVPALRLLDYDINTEDQGQMEEAAALLIEQKPIVYAYYVDETADEVAAGNAAMALVYSGEAAYAAELNEDLAYTVPKEGSNLWIDSWFIPKNSAQKENAQMFLDFLCREDVAMVNFEYVWYGTPNLKVMEQLDEETLADATIFPTEEILSNCVVFKQFSQDTTERYNYLWKMLKSE